MCCAHFRKGVKKHYFYPRFVDKGFTPRPLREVFKKTKNVFLSIIDNYKENFTSLHLISAVSADITSGITSNITSAVGQKPQDFCLF